MVIVSGESFGASGDLRSWQRRGQETRAEREQRRRQGDRDLLNPNVMRDGMHDWVEANNRMAKVLQAKGYEYQYLFCRNAGHSIGNAQVQFLPHAIEWVWRGYAAKKSE